MPSAQAENKQLSAKIPADLSDWLEEEAKNSRLSKTSVLIEALQEYREKLALLKRSEDSFRKATLEALADAENPRNLLEGEAVISRLRAKYNSL